MGTIYDLLTLPKTSEGLTALRPAGLITTSPDEGSASPRLKVARLAADSDSASASRSKQGSQRNTRKNNGPIEMKIKGDYDPTPRAEDVKIGLRRDLRKCIGHILDPKDRDWKFRVPLSHEGIYDACRLLVTVFRLGERVYEDLREELKLATRKVAETLINSTANETDWIVSLNDLLGWFEQRTVLLGSLLTYLNQVFLVQNTSYISIRDLSYNIFRENVFEHAQIAVRLRTGVKTWLLYEQQLSLRHDARAEVATLIQHLIRHSQYPAMEQLYLNVTRNQYQERCSTRAEQLKDDPKLFFKEAHCHIEAEIARARDVLPPGAESIIRDATERATWEGRIDWLSNSILPSLIEAKDFKTLGTMYTLFCRVNGRDALCTAFRTYVRTSVDGIVNDRVHDDEMVDRLLAFKSSADDAISSAFIRDRVIVTIVKSTDTGITPSTSQLPPKEQDKDFVYALTDAFTAGFKTRKAKPAEMIAKYLDKAMRKGQGKASDDVFQDMLDKALALYRYTDDKDVFRRFYHRGLAKRLLLEKSASDDFEKSMLKILKEKYDPEFGMGEEMFKDLALSRESTRKWHRQQHDASSRLKLTAMVLQRSAWPFTVVTHSIDLPPSMQDDLTSYTNYYKSVHSGRVLNWDHSLGTVTMKARFQKGQKELTLSLYQAVVLLLFNDATRIQFKDIKVQTNLDDAELRRILQSLACGKKKVLKKEPPGREVDNSDVFVFNADFEDPRPKLHINSIQVKVSEEESQRTNTSIEEDRKYTLDAAIVRVMKAKKEMTFEQLKVATIDAVKNHFVPQVDMIKKRIDHLVEADYLEREEADRTRFKYIA